MANDGSVAPKERVNIPYMPAGGDGQAVELPLEILAIGDCTGRETLKAVLFQSLAAFPFIERILDGPKYAKWRSFRQSEDARYVGLGMPRFLLRLPYGRETTKASTFNFSEDVADHHDRHLVPGRQARELEVAQDPCPDRVRGRHETNAPRHDSRLRDR